MSMLAEPRRKVRYNINPNGNTWANDSNAFGKKMLEKMGWSNGKGLGANLDGMTTHVKVAHKSDQLGIGFKDRNDQWTAHEDNFAVLLKNLQSDGHQAVEIEAETEVEAKKLKSLELKSKASKSRVHYKKFTRGKDLSRYSSKDLANIFGRKTLEKAESNGEEEVEIEKEKKGEEEDSDESKDKKFGVETLQGGSMTDYFKKKMSQFKLNFNFSSKSTKSEDEEEDDDCGGPSFGFGFSQNTEITEVEAEPQKMNFKSGYGPNFVSSEDSNVNKEKKRKRKSEGDDITTTSSKKVKNDVHGVSNEGFEVINSENAEDNCDSGVSLDDNPYELKVKVKKCKKSKGEHLEVNVNDIQDAHKSKSKKKKKKVEEGVENPTFDESIDDNEEVVEEKIKKKKKKQVQDIDLETVLNPYEVVVKDKKKKKKKKTDEDLDVGVENPVFEDNCEEKLKKKKKKQVQNDLDPETVLNPYEVVVKEKKQKKEDDLVVGIENPVFDENNDNNEEIVEEKSKKKKKKEKQVQNDLDVDLHPETVVNPYEVVVKEKKKKKKKKFEEKLDLGIENPVFDDNVPKKKKKAEESFTTEEINESQDVSIEASPKKHKKRKNEQPVELEEKIQAVDLDVSNNFGITDGLILNISSTDPKPILHTPQNTPNRLKRRKSVRIDESLNQERIIPNVLLQKQMELETKALEALSGISNPAYRNVQEEVENAQKSLENYQAEVENDINIIKQQQQKVTAEDLNIGNDNRYIGTVSRLSEHEKLQNGNVKLAFARANITESMNYFDMTTQSIAKRSYKHLVKGDVEVEFNGTNLHEITGYATEETIVKKKSKAIYLNGGDENVDSNVNFVNESEVKRLALPIPKGHVTDMEALERLTKKKDREKGWRAKHKAYRKKNQ